MVLEGFATAVTEAVLDKLLGAGTISELPLVMGVGAYTLFLAVVVRFGDRSS